MTKKPIPIYSYILNASDGGVFSGVSSMHIEEHWVALVLRNVNPRGKDSRSIRIEG